MHDDKGMRTGAHQAASHSGRNHASAYGEKNEFSRAALLLSLPNEQAILVCHLTTAYDIWKRLSEAHSRTSAVNLVLVQRSFFAVMMRDSESAIEFVSRVQRIFTQLKDADKESTPTRCRSDWGVIYWNRASNT